MSSIIQAQDIFKIYRDGEYMIHALHDVTLDIEAGETIAITGESGAGKSTLLHVFGLLDTPTSGSMLYRGTELSELDQEEQANIRNQHFGFVFQFFHLLPDLNATENVLLPHMISSGYFGWRRSAMKTLALEALDKVGLADRARHRPGQLSGGEKQRVAIARALVRNPDIVFCDEPTGNLDSQTSADIHNLLFDLNKQTGQTFVIVTHDKSLAARAGRIARMNDGSISEIVTGTSGAAS